MKKSDPGGFLPDTLTIHWKMRQPHDELLLSEIKGNSIRFLVR